MVGEGPRDARLWSGWEALAEPSSLAGFLVIVLACALIALRGLGPILAALAAALRR